MKSLIHIVGCLLLVVLSASCSDVKLKSEKGKGGVGQTCQGTSCPPGSYSWFEGGFNICSKPCGGGTQTQTVECRRNSDNVAVPDSFCTGTKPASSRTCNAQTCTSTYTWNAGPWGTCSKTCGGGNRTRTVVCQDQAGATVADSNCSAANKPATSETCNTNTCPPVNPAWHVTPGTCSKPCGGGTATDVVVCKAADGTIVADSYCSATPKPPTTRTCNTHTCPLTYTYAWEPGSWSTCSKTCGDGTQTRTVTCKRNDGQYVAESFCTGTKPATQQTCKIKDCPPTGRAVTQTVTVTPALNSVDVILIVDDSASMKEDQAKLASRMAGMLTDLDALNIDYQVCLTTTDIGHYKGAPIRWKGPNSYIMNTSTPSKNSVFINTIDSLGAVWSSDEQGIKATHLMIKDWRSTGCLRNSATLTTILVSDENERSVGGNASWSISQYKPLTPENMPDNLISLVKTTFGAAKKFIWNSIIVKPGDAACEAIQDVQSPAFFGTLYAELSNKTGGHIGSICDNDYSTNLSYIKERTVNSMPGITMECTPIDTPVVTFVPTVNTTITVTGNQIRFSPALNEGVRVTARYTCPN